MVGVMTEIHRLTHPNKCCTDRHWEDAESFIVSTALLFQQGDTHLSTDNKAVSNTCTAAATALSDKEQLQSVLEE